MTTKLLLRIFFGSLVVSAVYFLTMFYSPYYSGVAVLLLHMCLLGLLYMSTSHLHKIYTTRIYIHIAFILILALRYAIYMQYTLHIVNAWLLLFLDISLFTQFVWGYMQSSGVGSHMRKMLSYIWESISTIKKVPKYFSGLGSKISNGIDIGKVKPSKKISEIGTSVGLLLLLLLIIIPLLKSADLGFSKIVDQFFQIFTLDINIDRNIDIGNTLRKILWIGVGTWFISAGVFTLYEKREIKIVDAKEDIEPIYSLTDINMYVILGGVNLVYILFVITQFAFMFNGNHQAILDRGIESYSDYIHRGFRQLVAIALINIVLYFVFWKHKKQKIRTFMLGILIGCTIVVLVSASMRTMMYIEAYGMTMLRSLVIWAIVVIGLICVYLIYRLRDRRSAPSRVILYTVLSCRVIFGYINIDAYIANHNIAAIEDLPADYEENREIYGPFKKSLILDENYIYRLSNDALEQKISLRTPTSDDNKKNHIYELITNEILDAPRYNRNRSVSKAYIYKESQKNLYEGVGE